MGRTGSLDDREGWEIGAGIHPPPFPWVPGTVPGGRTAGATSIGPCAPFDPRARGRVLLPVIGPGRQARERGRSDYAIMLPRFPDLARRGRDGRLQGRRSSTFASPLS